MSDLQVLLPTTDRNMAGARLVLAKVTEAVYVLEIERPVTIRWANGTWRKGSHSYREGKHAIRLSTYYDAEATSRTLWHEFMHAVQVEACAEGPHSFYRSYWRANRAQGYMDNPFEVAARSLAELMAEEPLAEQGPARGAPKARPIEQPRLFLLGSCAEIRPAPAPGTP
jgi:hypothetical protein